MRASRAAARVVHHLASYAAETALWRKILT